MSFHPKSLYLSSIEHVITHNFNIQYLKDNLPKTVFRDIFDPKYLKFIEKDKFFMNYSLIFWDGENTSVDHFIAVMSDNSTCPTYGYIENHIIAKFYKVYKNDKLLGKFCSDCYFQVGGRLVKKYEKHYNINMCELTNYVQDLSNWCCSCYTTALFKIRDSRCICSKKCFNSHDDSDDDYCYDKELYIRKRKFSIGNEQQ